MQILEALSHRIWIPRQFWEEYRRRRPEMHAFISRKYKQTQASLQSSRDKSKNTLLRLTERYSFDSTQHILAIDAFYNELIGTVRSSSIEYICRAEFDEVDERIAKLCAGRVGDLLPDSTIADIPSMWQWRLNHGIPPGLKDRRKPEPERYGDLIGWLQTKRHAIGRDRPVIMVTDDVKAGDWFDLKNGNPSGPQPDLTRELYDEAGVELYMYTSEQFMRLADMYLKWQRSVAAAGEVFPPHIPALLPGFSRFAAIESKTFVTEMGSIFDDYERSISAIAGMNVFDDRMERLHESLAGFSAFSDTLDQLHDSLIGVSAFNERFNQSLNSIARLTVGLSSNSLLDYSLQHLEDSVEVINMLDERWKHMHDTLTGFNTLGENMNQIHDAFAAVSTFGDRWKHVHDTLTGFNTIRESIKLNLEPPLMISEVMKGYLEPNLMISDAVKRELEPLRITSELMKSVLEPDLMISDAVKRVLEPPRMTSELVKGYLEPDLMIGDTMKSIIDQHSITGGMMKPFLDLQQNTMADTVKSIIDHSSIAAGVMKPFLKAQQRQTDDEEALS